MSSFLKYGNINRIDFVRNLLYNGYARGCCLLLYPFVAFLAEKAFITPHKKAVYPFLLMGILRAGKRGADNFISKKFDALEETQ